jgi:hypothetical protein
LRLLRPRRGGVPSFYMPKGMNGLAGNRHRATFKLGRHSGYSLLSAHFLSLRLHSLRPLGLAAAGALLGTPLVVGRRALNAACLFDEMCQRRASVLLQSLFAPSVTVLAAWFHSKQVGASGAPPEILLSSCVSSAPFLLVCQTVQTLGSGVTGPTHQQGYVQVSRDCFL